MPEDFKEVLDAALLEMGEAGVSHGRNLSRDEIVAYLRMLAGFMIEQRRSIPFWRLLARESHTGAAAALLAASDRIGLMGRRHNV